MSHGHGRMVEQLLGVLLNCDGVRQVILTLNLPEAIDIKANAKLHIIINETPKGFAANHNAAFRHCQEPYFCVLNPDIYLSTASFAELIEIFHHSGASIVAPQMLNQYGASEDNFRYFPTPVSIFRKILFDDKGIHENGSATAQVKSSRTFFYANWVAGMFMLIKSDAYEDLKGFDEQFYLYYEDVDLCVRAWNNGFFVAAAPHIKVTHIARRDSHRHIQYAFYHLASMLKYFLKHCCRLPNIYKVCGK